VQTKTMGCSCGSEAKLSSKKNYPFGVKSKGITSWFYKCKSCKLVTFQDKDMGGKK
jgi:hypothetical protein